MVLNDGIRRRLAEAAHDQHFLAEAPASIVVSAEPGRSAAQYGARGETLYAIQDAAAAVENILLAATGYGLGTCWVGAIDEDAVRRAADLPPGHRPLAVIAVGYAAEEGRETPLRPQEEVTRVLR